MAQETIQQECASDSKNKPASTESTKFKMKKEKNYQTKVVIRRLPPTMTEEQFVHQIAPMPENDYFYFVKGDLSLGLNSFSRAYINFLNPTEILIFKEQFDNYVFVDSKGTEYPAVVEFSPFQKIPKKKTKKRDPKCGTIEQDPDYIKFVEKLHVEEEPPPAEVVLEPQEKANNGVTKMTTPLIDFIREKKQAQLKQREEKKEERKRREQERRKLREETRRKKKADKEKPVKERKESSDKETEEPAAATAQEDTNPLENVTVLKNPEREKERDKDPSVPSGSKTAAAEHKQPAFKPKSWSKFRDQEKSEGQTNRCFSRKKPESRGASSNSEAKKTQANKPHPEDEDDDDSVETPFKEDGSKFERRVRNKVAGVEPQKVGHPIRNKDRPSLEIYRPGMRRLSAHRSSPHKSTSASNSSTPSPTPAATNSKTSPPPEWST